MSVREEFEKAFDDYWHSHTDDMRKSGWTERMATWAAQWAMERIAREFPSSGLGYGDTRIAAHINKLARELADK